MSVSKIGVCCWSLLVKSVHELEQLLYDVGADVTQIALGDPNHAMWSEGGDFVNVLAQAGLGLTATMIGFPGEDYSTPEANRRTAGLGCVALRAERLELLKTAIRTTQVLGLELLTMHAGFIAQRSSPDRQSFIDCLAEAASFAADHQVTLCLETGQESAYLLRQTLDDIGLWSLKVNFDPANMIMYGAGDPLTAVKILGADIAHVHVKDAIAPRVPGEWGQEMRLGEGDVGMADYLEALQAVGYRGPLVIEREEGTQMERINDVRRGIGLLRRLQIEAQTLPR